ncbi:HNH endonuclease family protein, partial [Pseudomonas sp.]|uniref:HNH endonuclease family protein n=1 Tax=Pseudomonas sp. TaxID=306 RepID=UPI003C552251
TAQVSKTVKNYLEGLVKHLDVQSALPLVLAGYVCLSPTDFEKLLKRIISIYIRHTLIANQNPTDLETAFYEAARAIRSSRTSGKSSKQALKSAKPLLDKLNPIDSLVQQKTEDLVLTQSEAGWIMREIANSKQSATKEIGMDQANVEHVFPRNAGAEWPTRTVLEPYIWNIGNLTVLGRKINNKAANKAYADKYKDQYSISEIKITKELPNTKVWDVAAIQKRAAEYGKLIVTIWS